jgi:hypothetical protein
MPPGRAGAILPACLILMGDWCDRFATKASRKRARLSWMGWSFEEHRREKYRDDG